jgi:hypothetical protein
MNDLAIGTHRANGRELLLDARIQAEILPWLTFRHERRS